MQQTKEPAVTTIDGHTYHLTLLPAWQNLELAPTVGKLVAPVLSTLAKLAASEDAGESLVLDGVGDGLGKLLSAITPQELRQLTAKLLTGSMVTLGETGTTTQLMPIFDTHFQGRPMAMLRLIGFGVQANYQDFAKGLRMLGERAKREKPSSPPNTEQPGLEQPVIPSKTSGPGTSGPRGG